jgi:thiol-disulfide isomerase/thioredoxin
MLDYRAMLTRSAALLGFVFTAVIAAEQAVPTVNSWADYRALLKSQGKSQAEIDAKVADLLAAMKTMDRTIGNDRIGMAAPPFQFDEWLNSKPLAVEDLRGSVALIRWWTDTCPMCASTSPTLRMFHEQYSAKGLKVIGVFHPKFDRDKPIDVERVRQAVASRQYLFPVAIDWNWRTLNGWWLNSRPKGERVPTSVTFILDRKGVVRFVHPGMEYHDGAPSQEHAACENDFHVIRGTVERLLSE